LNNELGLKIWAFVYRCTIWHDWNILSYTPYREIYYNYIWCDFNLCPTWFS